MDQEACFQISRKVYSREINVAEDDFIFQESLTLATKFFKLNQKKKIPSTLLGWHSEKKLKTIEYNVVILIWRKSAWNWFYQWIVLTFFF